MKSLTGKAKAILKSNSGESLMECVVSIMLFTMLFATVALMVNTSLTMTANSTADAGRMQEAANSARLLNPPDPDNACNATLKLKLADGSIVDIPIEIATVEAFTAFAYKEVTPP